MIKQIKSSEIKNYIKENGVPERRKLPLLRRFKMNRKYK